MSPSPGSPAPPPSGSFVAPSPEELSAMLPAYEVQRLVATGGMGAVYAGLQKALDRPVAIKILPPATARDGESIQRFRTEAKAMARLTHPHIPVVYDFDVSSGYCYLVMELVNGSTVHQLISRRELTPALTLKLLAQVCDALHFAHQNGVVHGDIKPANLLVTQDGRLKLADFGLAQLRDASSRAAASPTPMGTPEYAAPELWQPGVVLDHRADLYSLGCVFFEMLTGAPPQGHFTLPAAALHLDPRVDAVISRCMQPDPAQRFQSAAELQQALAAIRLSPVGNPSPNATARPTAHPTVRSLRHPPRRIPVSSSHKKASSSPLLWLLPIALVAAIIALLFKGKQAFDPPPQPLPSTAKPTRSS